MSWGLTTKNTLIRNTILFCKKLEDKNMAEIVNMFLIKYDKWSKVDSKLLLVDLAFKNPTTQHKRINSLRKEINGKLSSVSESFFSDVELLCEKLQLGREWQSPVANLLITGCMAVPHVNFYIPTTDECVSNQEGLILILNSSTSLDDITKNFDVILKEQAQRFPLAKKYKITSKLLEHYRIYLMCTPSFRHLFSVAQVMGEMSEFDSVLFNNVSKTVNERIDDINKQRKRDGRKPLKYKSEMSTRDMIKRYSKHGMKPSTKVNFQKRLVAIRQAIHRVKSVTFH